MVAERTGGAGGGGGDGLVFAGRARIAATVVESGACERGLVLGGGAGEPLGGWACGVSHGLARGEGEVVLTGGTLEDPADTSLLDAVGSARWQSIIGRCLDTAAKRCDCFDVDAIGCPVLFCGVVDIFGGVIHCVIKV